MSKIHINDIYKYLPLKVSPVVVGFIKIVRDPLDSNIDINCIF